MLSAMEVAERLNGRESGTGYMACCPAHEDDKASLSINDGDKVGVVVKCHAGCSQELILDGLLRKDIDLRGHQNTNKPTYTNYDYTDEHGKLLYQAVRKETPGEKKGFFQRKPEGTSWNYKIVDVRRVLYHLPEVITAVTKGETVYIVEGEKDVNNLRLYGLTATCNVAGAGKWLDEYSEVLRGANVVILPDNDKPGRDHAEQIAASLQKNGAAIRVVNLPNLPNKGDVSDWLGAGNTIEALYQLVNDTPLVSNIVSNDHNAKSTPEKQSETIIKALHQLGYSFVMNRCGDIVEVNGKPINDEVLLTMRANMRDLGFKNMTAIDEAFVKEASSNAYHPIKDYLNNLVWDGTTRIDNLASFLHSDDAPMVYSDGKSIPLHRLYLCRWLIGAVAKALDNHQNMMLVLAGTQRIGKSYFVNWLCSGIPDYFIEDKINPDDKDNAIRLMSKFIWEVGELDATTRKADVSALKDFITRKVVTVRRAYGRYDTTGPAIASLIGTVNNNNGFLVDETGNRRFFVTNITHIDHGYTTLDIDQVWAEAVQLYRDGIDWQLLPEEAQRQAEQNKVYEVESILESQLRMHFNCVASCDEHMTSAEIVAHLKEKGIIVAGNSKSQANEIASACSKVGVQKYRTSVYRGYKGIAPQQ